MLSKLDHRFVDVVLLDLRMPVMDGFQACKEISGRYPKTKILVLSHATSNENIKRLIDLVASGYVTKNADPETLYLAVIGVKQKGFYFEHGLGEIISILKDTHSQASSSVLTSKEVEIIDLYCRELSTRQIASKLFLSPRTVEGYKSKMVEKLQTIGFTGVIIYAIKNRLITLDGI